MKRFIYAALVLFTLSALASCTSYNYYTAGLNKTNLSGYHSFAWAPMGNPDNSRKSTPAGMADETIKSAASAALQQKGLRLSQNNPDLLVSYTNKVGRGTKTVFYDTYAGYPYFGGFYGGLGWGWGGRFGWGWGGGFGYGWGGYGYPYGGGLYTGSYADKEHYKEGTLIIDLIDSHTHKIVWRGFGVGDAHNSEKTIKDLPKVVDGIIAQINLTVPFYRGVKSTRG